MLFLLLNHFKKLEQMNAELTPYQFERIIQLLDEKYKETDSSFYCGLRNNLEDQYTKEIKRVTELMRKQFEATTN